MENVQEKNTSYSPISHALDVTSNIVANKRSRSIVFLIISFFLILGINALLPVIEGDTHFTAAAKTASYSDYVSVKENLADSNHENYRLTWGSEQDIKIAKAAYNTDAKGAATFLEYTINEDIDVSYYTKFFFETPTWYITTMTSLASSLILYYGVFNYLNIRSKETDVKYLKLERDVTYLTDTSLDPIFFEGWMENDFNKRRKINQHRANIKYKLDRLERVTSYKIKQSCRHLADGEMPKTHKEIRYINKKRKLLALLDDAYIEQYVVSGHVRFFKYIYPMFVYNGDNSMGRTIDSYSNISTDTKRISSDAASKVSISLGITLLFAVLLTVTVVSSLNQDPMWIIINIISKIVPLFIQIPLALEYNQSFMKSHLIGNLYSRRAIALLYLAENGKTQPLMDAAHSDKEVLANAQKN